jgi:hypothetical protein
VHGKKVEGSEAVGVWGGGVGAPDNSMPEVGHGMVLISNVLDCCSRIRACKRYSQRRFHLGHFRRHIRGSYYLYKDSSHAWVGCSSCGRMHTHDF